MNDTIRQRLPVVVATVLRVPHLPREFDCGKPLANVGMDSIRALELILRVEEEFGIEVPDQHLGEVIVDYSFDELARLIERQLSAVPG
jgi:acyl carrier protein